METKVHSIHFKADQKLVDFIQERVHKLELFNHKAISGKELFAKKQCKTFEESVDEVVEALRKQILKEKEK
jgi:putative sigma-54 modulation protein